MTKKRILTFFMVLALASTALFADTTTYGVFIRKAAGAIAENADGAKLSVMPLEDANDEFNKVFTTDLESLLIDKDATVLNRSSIDAIIKELEFQTSGMVDEDTAVSIGHMLGAEMLVTGSAKNYIDCYRIELKLIDLETTLVKYQGTFDLEYDTELKNMMKDNKNRRGTQKFAIGLRAGSGYFFNEGHHDMINGIAAPKETSLFPFTGALSFSYDVLDFLTLQTEVDFYVNSGLRIRDTGVDIAVNYSALDVPLLLKFNVVTSPVVVSLFAGGHVSFPIGKVAIDMLEPLERHVSYQTSGYVWGFEGGIDVGIPMGPGRLVTDVRYVHDFGSFSALTPLDEEGKEMGNQGLMYRRGVAFTAGYSFAL